MTFKIAASKVWLCSRVAIAILAALQNSCGGSSGNTGTPIQHVIVIIGENRSFDHVFATYTPPSGQNVWNLLSQGIVKADGSPGANFSSARQSAATDLASNAFLLNPPKSSFPNNVLPAPLVGGPSDSYIAGDSLSLAQASEPDLPGDYYQYLLGGGSGQNRGIPDARISNVNALPPGPFQLTNGTTFTYDSYEGSPVHRFYQMWQQLDCALTHATAQRPSGCDSALFSWVEVSVGIGGSGSPPAANFSIEYSPTASTTFEGSASLGFYNMQNGDVPYFKSLADTYSMSDNFHQSVNGGTGANHIMLGHADMIWFSDGAGNPMTPPENMPDNPTANARTVSEIENPNPLAGTNNWYAQDGYGGGSYSNCADTSQPGVAPITDYLGSLPRPIDPRCEAGHYYLLNNYNPGYHGDGANAFTDPSPHNLALTIPPSSVRSIGDVMLAANLSWKYYGEQWNNYVNDPYQLNSNAIGANTDEYCIQCNPFQYDTSIMANAAVRTAHLQDTSDLYADIANGTLPAVSFVKPDALVDGHPDSSKLELFEGFVRKLVEAVQNNPALWTNTAIFITFDEGGGYYDSGYVQPLDFFGDGTRIPFLVVSRYAKKGFISHDYTDHVSILKFIERNWKLPPITARSRDNFPDPIADPGNVYVPLNSPAIGDLFDMFSF
jgi:phospholipase C